MKQAEGVVGIMGVLSRKVFIGDVFKVSSGGTPNRKKQEYFDGGHIPWVKTGELKGKFANNPSEFITQSGLDNSSAKLFPPKTVLLAMYGATIGACSILDFEAATNQACAAILPTDDCDESYLYYYLSSIKPSLVNKGVGGAQPNISAGLIKKIKIPLPPLAEQKKIAAILDVADRLRQKDAQLIAKYNELSQSLFLDMFGDPVTNPMGWGYSELSNLVTKLGDGLHGTPIYDDEGKYHFVNGNNLQHGEIEFNLKTKKVNESEYFKHKKELNDSTMLVSINGTIGKVAFYKGEKIILGKSACYFNVKRALVNMKYLFCLIESPYFIKYASDLATGSTIKNVSLKTMRAFPVPLPPITLQNQFAERIRHIEAQKQQAQAVLQKSDDLFHSLLQRAFKGELTEQSKTEGL